MGRRRLTIAGLLGLILVLGLIFAGLRSASNDAFKSIYSLTFLALVLAAIAARYRGAFWHGFAVAGWAYFVFGFGPWIGRPTSFEGPNAVNRNLVSTVVLEVVTGTMARIDFQTSGNQGMAGMTDFWLRQANRDGIGHCALTILFAYGGGWVARALARRPRD